MSNEPILFYDGNCGLCHGAVRFVIKNDRNQIFKFSPIGSETFNSLVKKAQRNSLPDSMIVHTDTGELLTKSSAVIYIMKQLGGGWSFIAASTSILPESLADKLYDFIARNRRRIFKKPDDVCPVMPLKLRERFLQ